MIDDLAKLVAYGYMGLALERQFDQEAEKRIQDLKKNIIVVYDGKSAYNAVQNLLMFTKGLGYETLVVDSDQYRTLQAESREPLEKFINVIIVGHHQLAQEQFNRVELKYDYHGLKIGATGQLYVLMASSTELNRDKENRQVFAAYYNEKMSAYGEAIEPFAVPKTFGSRRRIIESQYDLLWLEFAQYFLYPLFYNSYQERIKPMGIKVITKDNKTADCGSAD